MIVAFDVDGTLINKNDQPRPEIIDLLRQHHANGDTVYVWSGGGIFYARDWAHRLKIAQYVTGYIAKTATPGIDVAYDDLPVKLAKENVCVGEEEE